MSTSYKPRWTIGIPKSFHEAQRDMDHLFERFFPLSNGGEAGALGTLNAPLALWEENDAVCVAVELPGVKREDVDVTLENNTLRIVAERKLPESERKYWHQERSFGKVQRIISLPETVAPDTIDAELKDGVLSLKITKRPEVQPRKIAIKGE